MLSHPGPDKYCMHLVRCLYASAHIYTLSGDDCFPDDENRKVMSLYVIM